MPDGPHERPSTSRAGACSRIQLDPRCRAHYQRLRELRQRDPEAFAQLITDATAGGPVTDVFISAQTLAQSGKAQGATELARRQSTFQAALKTLR